MATTLPVYHASLSWPRYSFVYFGEIDLSHYKGWAKRRPAYFDRRASTRRMASGVPMRISVRSNKRSDPEITLDNVVKDSKQNVSLISEEKARATRGTWIESSSSSYSSHFTINLRVRRLSCAVSESETFLIVNHCPGGYDAILRQNLNLEQVLGAYPVGLSHQSKKEKQEQDRRDEEARKRREEEKAREDRRIEEEYERRRQQSGGGHPPL